MSDLSIEVLEIWRYPVKSMGGERLDTAVVEARGLVGDRGLALVTADGKIASGKTTRRFVRVEGLLPYVARTDPDGDVVIVCPDGVELRAGDPAADQELSRRLGTPLQVRAESTIRHHDEAPLHALTTRDLDSLADRCGDRTIDVRRFRPNLLLEAQRDLLSSQLVDADLESSNGMQIEAISLAERCPMITHSQPGPEMYGRPLLAIAADHDNQFGLYLRRPTPLSCSSPRSWPTLQPVSAVSLKRSASTTSTTGRRCPDRERRRRPRPHDCERAVVHRRQSVVRLDPRRITMSNRWTM
jgi:uncharacterized protein YcbX